MSKMGTQTIDITGQIYGKLTVIGYSHKSGNSHTYWKCKCECGNEHVTSKLALKRGYTKSCGCYAMEVHRLYHGQAMLNRTYATYKNNAKTRGYEFLLSKEEFSRLCGLDCYYCGTPPSNTSSRTKTYGVYLYNGIDRLDNDKGYIKGNLVPCCKKCNRAKDKYSYLDFKLWISKIADHMLSKDVLYAR